MRRQYASSPRHIYLIGFSGSGKSSVAERLAAKLNYRFLDVDATISTKLRLSIAEIFEKYGERAFRQEETNVLNACAIELRPTVVSVGGGGVERGRNRRLMWQSGRTVYLRCSLKSIRQRLRGTVDRPLLRGPKIPLNVMRTLLNRRKPIYELADFTVVTSNRTISQVVNQIRKLVTTL